MFSLCYNGIELCYKYFSILRVAIYIILFFVLTIKNHDFVFTVIGITNKRIGGGGGGWKIIGMVGDDRKCGNANLVL